VYGTHILCGCEIVEKNELVRVGPKRTQKNNKWFLLTPPRHFLFAGRPFPQKKEHAMDAPEDTFLENVKRGLKKPLTEEVAKMLTPAVMQFLAAAGTKSQSADSYGVFKDGVKPTTNLLALLGVLRAAGKAGGKFGVVSSTHNKLPSLSYWNHMRLQVVAIVKGAQFMPPLTSRTLDFWKTQAVASFVFVNDEMEFTTLPGTVVQPSLRFPVPNTPEEIRRMPPKRKKIAPDTIAKVRSSVQVIPLHNGCKTIPGGNVDVVGVLALRFLAELARECFVECDAHTFNTYASTCVGDALSEGRINDLVTKIKALKPVAAEAPLPEAPKRKAADGKAKSRKKPRAGKRTAVAEEEEHEAASAEAEEAEEGEEKEEEEGEDKDGDGDGEEKEEEGEEHDAGLGGDVFKDKEPAKVVQEAFWSTPVLSAYPPSLYPPVRNPAEVRELLLEEGITNRNPFYSQILATALAMPVSNKGVNKVEVVRTPFGSQKYFVQGDAVLKRALRNATLYMALTKSTSNVVPIVGKPVRRNEDGTLKLDDLTEHQAAMATKLNDAAKTPAVTGFDTMDAIERALALATVVLPNTPVLTVSRDIVAKKKEPYASKAAVEADVRARLLGPGVFPVLDRTKAYIAYITEFLASGVAARPDFAPWKRRTSKGMEFLPEGVDALLPGQRVVLCIGFKSYVKDNVPGVKNVFSELALVKAAHPEFVGVGSKSRRGLDLDQVDSMPEEDIELAVEQATSMRREGTFVTGKPSGTMVTGEGGGAPAGAGAGAPSAFTSGARPEFDAASTTMPMPTDFAW
jgi:hypothetical protein